MCSEQPEAESVSKAGAFRPDTRPLAAGLYFVSTPIGAARDITLRGLDILAKAELALDEVDYVLYVGGSSFNIFLQSLCSGFNILFEVLSARSRALLFLLAIKYSPRPFSTKPSA